MGGGGWCALARSDDLRARETRTRRASVRVRDTRPVVELAVPFLLLSDLGSRNRWWGVVRVSGRDRRRRGTAQNGFSPLTAGLASGGCALRLFTTRRLAAGDPLLLFGFSLGQCDAPRWFL